MAAGAPGLVEEPVTADEAIALISKAKAVVEGDMGVKAAEMLSPDFRFLWQFNGDMAKADYLTEGKGPYATLRTALPDLFWNSYDYRVDKYNRNRVWATTRLTGTHNGPLVFDGKEYPPSGSRVEAAPECVSVVFDESGLVTKITGGFCLDRGMGNTGPAGGIWGVLQAIGDPVPAWKYFPPVKVAADVVGPTFRPKKSPGPAKSPFRDAVAIALAKQVLTAGRDDPESLADLLADDLMAYAPILGPLKKKEFVQSTTVDLADFFAGLDTTDNFHDARVDPFEPRRVWITSTPAIKVVGPLEVFGAKFEPKKQSYVGTPATYSVTFDEAGFASKITPTAAAAKKPTAAAAKKAAPPASKKPAPARPATLGLGAGKKAAAPAAKKTAAAPTKKPAPLFGAVAKPPAAAKPAAKPAPKATPPSKPAGAPAAGKGTGGSSFGGFFSNAAPPKPPAVKPAAKPAPAPIPKAAPARKAAPAKSAASASPSKTPPRQTAAAKGGGSPFGGLFGNAAPKSPAAKPAAKPAAAPKAAPARKAAPAKPAASAPSGAAKPAAAAAAKGGGSSFGGLFGGKAGGETKKAGGETKKTEAPKKKAAPAPAPAPAPAKKAAAPAAAKTPAGSVAFPPALTQKLEDVLGSPQRVEQLSKRTELFARGGISAQNYWSTLKDTLGADGAQNLGPDIIGSLPAGNQKSALFKIFSTG
eukprot:g8503.t1